MKKYNNLSELFKNYRHIKNITQVDLAILLEVDSRTISRWENGDSLINMDKEDFVCDKLFLPYQVIHNLNSEHPIAIFCEIESRTYSFSLFGTKLVDTGLFKSDTLVEEERIKALNQEDVAIIQQLKSMRAGNNIISEKVLIKSSELLPELNRVLKDQAGFHGGHISFIPLKLETYQKLKEKSTDEKNFTTKDLADVADHGNCVYYFYSLYSDSMVNAFYLMTKSIRFFKKRRYSNYLVAGMAYRELALKMHTDMGLEKIWGENLINVDFPKRYLLEGNYNSYLFK